MRLIQRSGMELILALTLVGLLSAVGLAALTMATSYGQLQTRDVRREQIYHIAEAGVNYYRWRLAHFPNDFTDGTGQPGPYVHDFKDGSGTVIGRYELTITPPVLGSTIATIQSSGYVLSNPNAKRTLLVKFGIPSWARYAVVANDNMRFGQGTTVSGPLHSNGGIRFDGIAQGLVTSALTSYDDPDHAGAVEYGVHTHVNPPPASGIDNTWRDNEAPPPNPPAPSRPDVFPGGRQFPVAPVDFAAITADLAALKTQALNAGMYLGLSGGQGYHITLRSDDTVDIRIVNTSLRCQYQSGGSWFDYGYCSNNFYRACNSSNNCRTCTGNPSIFCTNNLTCSTQGAGSCGATGAACTLSSHSIGSRAADQTVVALGQDMPANGIIFVQDDVWVDGTIDTARVTIVAAKDPIATGQANIYLTNDLRYTHTDGSDVIGLIAQNNILAGYFSENNLQIDAALLAQKGLVGRPFYGSSFTTSNSSSNFQLIPSGSPLPDGGASETSCRQFRSRSTLTSNGSIGTYLRYGFSWVGNYCSNDASRSCTSNANCLSGGICILFDCGSGLYNNSGYCTRTLNFDSDLTFAPPPSFPTSGEYSVISFDEVQ